MKDIEKVIAYVRAHIAAPKERDKSGELLLLDNTLSIIEKMLTSLPTYEHTNMLDAILDITKENETDEP